MSTQTGILAGLFDTASPTLGRDRTTALSARLPMVQRSAKLAVCAMLSLLITGLSASVMNRSAVSPLTQAAAAQAVAQVSGPAPILR